MKLQTRIHLLPLAILLSQLTHAATLTWDANGTGAGQTDGAGTWLNANQWWDGAANLTWVANSNAIIGSGGAGGAITVGTVSAGTVMLDNFTGTYTLQGTGTTLTQSGGITIGAGAGNVTIKGTGASPNNFTISGAGGITMNDSGLLNAREHVVLSYTGPTVINSGTMMFHGNLPVGSNFTLNNGMATDYYRQTHSFANGLGTGAGQIQVYGDSGFGSGNGNGNWRIGSSGSTLIWGALGEGSATGYFNPTSLKLRSTADNNGTGIYGQVTLDNGLDLNGAARSVQVLAGTGTNGITSAWGKIGGVISGSGGSLIKTGGGILHLTAANTYDGGTTINQGNIRFTSLTAMPPAGNVTVNTGATLTVEAGGAGDWTSGASGVGTLGGLFAGLGSAGTSTVSFSGDATLGLEMTGNLTYSGDIPNLGNNLAIIKTGASSLTLTGNNSYSGKTWVHTGTLSFNSIADVGAGTSALGAPATIANGTISIGSDGATVTLAYAGSGHSSDRVIHLPAASGTATINASGTGPLTLASSLTASAGAKTLALTGTNTDANTLGTTSIPGLAAVLTIQKSGAGTWWINGFSSPKNAWSVAEGTLVVAGGITTGDQNVTVSGGTLAGVGPITLQSSKSLTVQAAGSLAPGNQAVGTLAVTGILNISAMAGGTGKLNFEMGPPAASDKISVTGTAQIGTGLLGLNDFVFTDLGTMVADTYTLISTTGGITGTLDPANISGTIGTVTGALRINDNNLEFVIDSDGDGMPDAWMTQYFGHPTGQESDLSRAGDDHDDDGLTNLQEYQLGTNPTNPDTDGDGLLDGVETNTGIWVSASNTGTSPLLFDTDGDTIRDGYETNTGIWVSSTNTGTNPLKRDSDSDGLADNVETGTGIYVSKTNTGTNPNLSDTDGDGAGDWYEITASFTSPFLATEKPNVPYPLPDPDSSKGDPSKPVKIYIMSGQSNMVGAGTVSGTGDGTLETMTLRQNKFPNLVTSSGSWTARQDVYYRGVISATADKPLGPGCGAKSGQLGPELGFGHVMGWFHDEGVLLLKSSIGNRALGWDILPAGSPRYEFGGFTYCGSGDAAEKWAVGSPAPTWTTGGWYAGYEWDRFFRDESEWIHPHDAVVNVVDILDNWSTQYYGGAGKHFDGRDFEIAGFVWWQGERDAGDAGHSSRYEQNLVHLINSLRSYYSNRYPGKVVPNAPFVMATLGETAETDGPSNSKTVFDAMMAVGNSSKYPQFVGNVKTVYSHPLSEGGSGNSHYNNRAGTYMLVGDALGRAMVELQGNVAPPGEGYAGWVDGPFAGTLTDTDPTLDYDGGGLATGIEWVLAGDPTNGNDDAFIAPTLDTTSDPDGKVLFVFRRSSEAGADANTTIQVQYGSDLGGWSNAVHQGSGANQITITEQANGFESGIDKVTVALPASLAASGKLFARLSVVVAP